MNRREPKRKTIHDKMKRANSENPASIYSPGNSSLKNESNLSPIVEIDKDKKVEYCDICFQDVK